MTEFVHMKTSAVETHLPLMTLVVTCVCITSLIFVKAAPPHTPFFLFFGHSNIEITENSDNYNNNDSDSSDDKKCRTCIL